MIQTFWINSQVIRTEFVVEKSDMLIMKKEKSETTGWRDISIGIFGLRFWLVYVFNGKSTIVGYLMPNPLFTYILDIYDLVGLGFMAYQPL